MKYFAYGSNMDKSQMKRRCSDSKFLGKAMIEGYWLDFTRESSNWDGGVADIVKDPDNFVWGILYDISDKDLESLDYYEACPVYYKRKEITVFYDNRNIKAISYEVVDKKPFIPPSKKYINCIIQAAIDNDFPGEYVEFLKSIKTH